MDELQKKRQLEWLEKQINPPAIVGPDTVILCPPISSVDDYMKYLKEHAEDYRRFFEGN